MICLVCNTQVEECRCPDLGARMREVSGPGGDVASRWCRACDQHYAVCQCERPRWMIRVDGKLRRLSRDQRILFPDLSDGVPA